MMTTAEKWRIRILLSVIFLLLFVLVGLMLRYGFVARAGSVKSTPLHLIPNTDVHPYGANFFLQWEADPFKREKTVEMAAQAGIAWAKQQFPWEDIEPAPGQFRWEKYDEIVNLYRKYGLKVIARLDRPPNWTRQDNRYAQRPPDDFTTYGDFVEQFIRHFAGRVQYIQIWNEPNIFPEWGDQPVDPVAYTELLKIAYQRAKAVDPNVFVLSAPLAINVENFPGRRNLSDLIYLDEMYQAGAADYFDILSANAFGMDRPPTDPPDPSVLNFRRIELQREVMVRHGDGDKPIWFNEYGWNAAPANFPPEKLIWRRVTEEQQAAWTVEGIEWARANWPWAGVFNIWYFRQIGNLSPNDADYYFRMVDVDFTPRRVYYAVQQATQRLRIASPGSHQETAPAVQPDENWQLRIEPRAGAKSHLVATRKGALLAFTFDGTGVDLIAYKGPQGGQLAVTIDGKPLATLPADPEGRRIVDLTAPAPLWRAEIPLTRNLPAGQHTLRLTVVDGEPAIDGFHVPLTHAPMFPVGPVLACVFGLLAVGLLLYRDVNQLTADLV